MLCYEYFRLLYRKRVRTIWGDGQIRLPRRAISHPQLLARASRGAIHIFICGALSLNHPNDAAESSTSSARRSTARLNNRLLLPPPLPLQWSLGALDWQSVGAEQPFDSWTGVRRSLCPTRRVPVSFSGMSHQSLLRDHSVYRYRPAERSRHGQRGSQDSSRRQPVRDILARAQFEQHPLSHHGPGLLAPRHPSSEIREVGKPALAAFGDDRLLAVGTESRQQG